MECYRFRFIILAGETPRFFCRVHRFEGMLCLDTVLFLCSISIFHFTVPHRIISSGNVPRPRRCHLRHPKEPPDGLHLGPGRARRHPLRGSLEDVLHGACGAGNVAVVLEWWWPGTGAHPDWGGPTGSRQRWAAHLHLLCCSGTAQNWEIVDQIW